MPELIPDKGTGSQADPWARLRAATPARIGLDRFGTGLSTASALQLGTAHARARDAVHIPLDVDAVAAALDEAGLGTPVRLASAAPDRVTYLARPDLGRRPADPSALAALGPADLVICISDGLSSTAVQQHAVPLLQALDPLLGREVRRAAPVICTQARVALADHVADACGASLLLVLIGERPGLSAHDSLGAYLTWEAKPGVTTDADRYCVSNIRPGGLGYAEAADRIAALVERARRQRGTGVSALARSTESRELTD